MAHSSIYYKRVGGEFFLICFRDRVGVEVRSSYLEELYANDSKHELQEAGDEDYVSDSLYRYDDALYYVLGSQH